MKTNPPPRMRLLTMEFSLPSTKRMMVGCLFLLTVGCSRGPVAPELRDSPVYQNRQEGFRILVPDGWTQSASANLPEGDLETELFLVRYNVKSPEPSAQVQILCLQDKTGAMDFAQHQQKPAFGVVNWIQKEAPMTKTVGGREGTWLYLTGRDRDREMGKEVLCFRKGDRVYSFVGLFKSSDDKARQAIHRAFESVIWD